MRAILQRVTSARVMIDSSEHSRIGPGWLALVGVEDADGPEDVEWLSRKLVELRVFEAEPVEGDPAGASPDPGRAREQSVGEIGGEILLVSQFTLFASTRKGTRPSWHRAARPPIAIPLYEALHQRVTELLGRRVPTGVFGAHMQLDLINDGPVTLCLDSKVRE